MNHRSAYHSLRTVEAALRGPCNPNQRRLLRTMLRRVADHLAECHCDAFAVGPALKVNDLAPWPDDIRGGDHA